MGRYDSYTKALLLMDGANASQTFKDETGRVWSAGGDAKLVTAEKKYGTASAYLDGTGDSIDTGASSDFDFGTGDMTIEMFVYRDGLQAQFTGLISLAYVGDSTGWTLYFTDGSGNKVGLVSKITGVWAININSSINLPVAWTHFALVRYGATMSMYFNGSSVGSWNLGGNNFNSSGHGIGIGKAYISVAGTFKGWIDEFRVSKGIARYTGNFTPPEKSFRVPGGLFTFHG